MTEGETNKNVGIYLQHQRWCYGPRPQLRRRNLKIELSFSVLAFRDSKIIYHENGTFLKALQTEEFENADFTFYF